MKSRTKILIFILIFPFIACRNTTEKSTLETYVRTLSSQEFEGRKSGTKGNIQAGNFIADKFSKFHLLKPVKNSYFQLFPLVEKFIGESYMVIENDTLRNFNQYVAANYTDIEDECEKQLIFAGNGTAQELNKINVKDKIVLVFTNSLKKTYEINEKLITKGAFGMIAVTPQNDEQFSILKKTSAFLLKKSILSVDESTSSNQNVFRVTSPKYINEFVIGNEYIKTVMGVPLSQLNGALIYNKIQEIPERKIKVKHRKIIQNFSGRNIVGMLKGTTEKTIVISAHYDHLGKNGKNYFPGADDNASGVAALLVLAEKLSQMKNLKYNIIFLASDAEESGLLGAEYFCSHLPFGKVENIMLDLNIDMIGRNDNQLKNNRLYVIGNLDKRLTDLFIKADLPFTQCDYDFNIKNETDYFLRSDQFAFWKKVIPSVMFFSGFHKDYHTYSDTYEKIDYQLFAYRIELISETVKKIIENF